MHNYLDVIDFFDSFELLYNIISKQNEIYFDRLSEKKIFLRSIFCSGELLKNEREIILNEKNKFYRADLISFIRTNDNKFIRYKKALNDALKLNVDKIIIGIRKCTS